MKIIKACCSITLIISSFLLQPGILMAMQDNEFPKENLYKRGLSLWQDGNKEEAFSNIKSEADKGHILALYDTAIMYREGIGTQKNLERYFDYCKLAAEKGSLLARNQLGVIYELGIIGTVEKDEDKAIQNYMLAAEKGLELSIRNLERILNIDIEEKPEQEKQKKTDILNVSGISTGDEDEILDNLIQMTRQQQKEKLNEEKNKNYKKGKIDSLKELLKDNIITPEQFEERLKNIN